MLCLNAKNLLIKKFNIITIIASPAFVTMFGIGKSNNKNPPINSTIIVKALPNINLQNCCIFAFSPLAFAWKTKSLLVIYAKITANNIAIKLSQIFILYN